MKTREWVQAFVNKLSDEVDAMEKELEALEAAAASGGGGGKKKLAPGEKTPEEALLGVVRNHRFHEEKLDALLQALEDGSVEPDAVDALKVRGSALMCPAPIAARTQQDDRVRPAPDERLSPRGRLPCAPAPNRPPAPRTTWTTTRTRRASPSTSRT